MEDTIAALPGETQRGSGEGGKTGDSKTLSFRRRVAVNSGMHGLRVVRVFGLMFLVICIQGRAEEAASPLPLRLSDALAMAKTRNIRLLVAEERVRQALARASQARSVFWPQISGRAAESRQKRNLDSQGIHLPGAGSSVGPFNSFDARVQLSQSIIDLSALERLAASKAQVSISRAQQEKEWQDVLALVATIYLQARRAAEAVELSNAVVQQHQEHWRMAKSRLELGMGTPVELSEAESNFATSRYQWERLKLEALQRRLDLLTALALPETRPIVFTEEGADSHFSPPPESDVVARIQEHPDLRVGRETLTQRQAEKSAEWMENLPKVAVTADYGESGKSLSRSEEVYTMGLQISMPFFEGGLRRARFEEAESRVHEAELVVTDTERQLKARALNAREELFQALELLKSSEAEWKLAEKQFAVAQEQLRNGSGSVLDVTDARVRLDTAQDHKLQAKESYQLAIISLAHATGEMDRILETPK